MTSLRRARSLVALACLPLVLLACGGGDGDEEETDRDDERETTTTAEDDEAADDGPAADEELVEEISQDIGSSHGTVAADTGGGGDGGEDPDDEGGGRDEELLLALEEQAAEIDIETEELEVVEGGTPDGGFLLALLRNDGSGAKVTVSDVDGTEFTEAYYDELETPFLLRRFSEEAEQTFHFPDGAALADEPGSDGELALAFDLLLDIPVDGSDGEGDATPPSTDPIGEAAELVAGGPAPVLLPDALPDALGDTPVFVTAESFDTGYFVSFTLEPDCVEELCTVGSFFAEVGGESFPGTESVELVDGTLGDFSPTICDEICSFSTPQLGDRRTVYGITFDLELEGDLIDADQREALIALADEAITAGPR